MPAKALLVIDLQNDYFPGGKWTLDNIETAAQNAVKVLNAAREQDYLIVHVRHEFQDNNAPFFQPNSEGAKHHKTVTPLDTEQVVVKHKVNAFLDTDLRTILDEAQIKEVTICGAMTHMCIDAAVRTASDLGYATTVIHDACASKDLEFEGKTIPASQVHAAYLSALQFGYAKMTSTDDFCG
jgi:nicotinamidase-related amidase